MHPVLWVQPPERPSRGSVWKLTPISARGLVHGHDGLDEFTRRVGYCHSRVSRNPASACKTTFCLVREWNWKVGAAVLSGDLRTSVDPSPFGRQRMTRAAPTSNVATTRHEKLRRASPLGRGGGRRQPAWVRFPTSQPTPGPDSPLPSQEGIPLRFSNLHHTAPSGVRLLRNSDRPSSEPNPTKYIDCSS